MARTIDGDALIAWIKGSQQMTSKMKNIICYIKTMPTVDAVSVVRCYECKHRTYCYSDVVMTNKSQTADIYKSVNFCSYGEKETEHE